MKVEEKVLVDKDLFQELVINFGDPAWVWRQQQLLMLDFEFDTEKSTITQLMNSAEDYE